MSDEEKIVIQVGDGRDEDAMERAKRKALGRLRLDQVYENQQLEPSEGGIGPAPEGGYDAPVPVTQNQAKIERKKRERKHMHGVQAEGSTVGLNTPGLTWTTEDAVDMGQNDVEQGPYADNQELF